MFLFGYPGTQFAMSLLILLFLVLALVCFVAAAFNIAARINLIALGLAFWVLSVIIQVWPK